MTIASTLTKKQYLGNGVTKEFPVPFFAADKSHVFAMLRTETGVTEITDNFEVDLTRNVFVYPKNGEALKTGQSITVFRKVPLTQIVDLENAGAFHPEVLERDGFDRIVMQIQQLDEAISRAIKIDITDNRDVSDLVEQLFRARDEAVKQAENAKLQAEASAEQAQQSAGSAEESGHYAELSRAWAESSTNPDSEDSQSKSSKSWALYAEEKLGELTALRVDCKISNSGVGEVIYSKEENLLEIILPFDNSGSQQPKVILTDEISLNRSDISASARAVSLLNAKCAADLSGQVQTINTALGKKLDKTAVVNNLTSTVTTSALSAAQGKVLNDKINTAIAKSYITETWKSGANWYRVWSDGFIEQGGEKSGSFTNNSQHTFLKPFKNAQSVFVGTLQVSGRYDDIVAMEISTTFFKSAIGRGSNVDGAYSYFRWYACGY